MNVKHLQEGRPDPDFSSKGLESLDHQMKKMEEVFENDREINEEYKIMRENILILERFIKRNLEGEKEGIKHFQQHLIDFANSADQFLSSLVKKYMEAEPTSLEKVDSFPKVAQFIAGLNRMIHEITTGAMKRLELGDK